VSNVQFSPSAENLPRKILLVGTYDPALTGVTEDVPQQVTSAEDAGSQFGFGFQAHMMAQAAFRKNAGIPVYVAPQAEAGGAVQAEGTITVTVTTAEAGTISLYIGGKNYRVPVAVTAGQTDAQIATAIAAAITDDDNLSVTAVAALGVVTLTAKSAGTYGNSISINTDLGAGEAKEEPGGVSLAIVDMASGATDPDIQDVLDAMGTGDDTNEGHFTDCVQGYGTATATLDAISTYNGTGNLAEGAYAPTVGRPMRWLNGDNTAGSAGLTAAKALAGGRKLDRTNGVESTPGSADHPVDTACEMIADAASINQAIAAQSVKGRGLTIDPGVSADRWTKDYANRDDAVKNGVGTTKVESGVVTQQDMVTFYHPDNVPAGSNGYRSMRNISIIQNMIYNMQLTFKQEKWQGISLVEDAALVTGPDASKVRDIDGVKDELGKLADAFGGKAWIFSPAFTKDNLTVTLRQNGTGFDTTFPVILSVQGDIINNEIQFDIALTVFLA
jgi:phage tail sheath gpL-like